MQTVSFWTVSVIGDCEGRSTKVLARFPSEEEANKFAESDAGRCMYRKVGDVTESKFQLYDTAEEAGAASFEWTKREALKKLTATERSVLGLD